MPNEFPYEHTKALLLAYLKDNPQGDYSGAVEGVVEIAVRTRVHTPKKPPDGRKYFELLEHHERENVGERVRQLLWQLLIQGVIVFGRNDLNPLWPLYRVTEYGEGVVKGQGPQPYDPNNFMQEFGRVNAAADPVIMDYLDEALRTFNHGCQKSTCVMIGAASEKAILLLHDAFETAIADAGKKAMFKKSYNWTIHSKYKALKAGLDTLVASNSMPRDLGEIVTGQVPGAFELIRRYRNSSGHPEIVKHVDPDTNFLTLRIFTEYVRCIYLLIDYCKANPVHL